MTPQIAQHTLNFLARVDFKGHEAPLLMACLEALRAEAAKQPEAVADA